VYISAEQKVSRKDEVQKHTKNENDAMQRSAKAEEETKS
jgi:hypothetical protein